VGNLFCQANLIHAIFAITQIPLAISEGILTVIIFNALRSNAPAELRTLGVETA
jgi:cobalt/nickel transport system permease protein